MGLSFVSLGGSGGKISPAFFSLIVSFFDFTLLELGLELFSRTLIIGIFISDSVSGLVKSDDIDMEVKHQTAATNHAMDTILQPGSQWQCLTHHVRKHPKDVVRLAHRKRVKAAHWLTTGGLH